MRKIKKTLALVLVFNFMFGFSATFAYGKDNASTRGVAVEIKKQELETDRVERKTNFETRKQELNTKRQKKLERKQLEFKEKLEARLEERAERLANHLNNLNAVLTDNYLKHLDKMEEVLDKILVRAGTIEEEKGLDLSSVEEAAETVRQKIEAARDAVLEQKEKVYVATIETKEDIGPTLREMMAEFKQDHSALREMLKDARRAIVDVFMALKDGLSDLNDGMNRGNRNNNSNTNDDNEDSDSDEQNDESANDE
ncbi:MAG: hypothetical protein A3H51_00265 [Candidatus Spechtbacteria bacterium RIFCSPLOWO2_02_FULL_38_8]|uniref:DUF5667 domain-containing protein n=1 Tax=Candidatus Spechtbacteria bacterium RIFCSPLOWO2_02_FULL_38_8 TaxID=1802164 RepID=A0A1G2HH89_9BACT|nr:MAG: hypothetical protein A3H51_00265 [Candidatus Spechtbacteria bacterium RIFCSPLOWO2_02_FULL_38_8]